MVKLFDESLLDKAMKDTKKIRECEKKRKNHKYTVYVRPIKPNPISISELYEHGHRHYYRCKYCPVIKPFKKKKKES